MKAFALADLQQAIEDGQRSTDLELRKVMALALLDIALQLKAIREMYEANN